MRGQKKGFRHSEESKIKTMDINDFKERLRRGRD